MIVNIAPGALVRDPVTKLALEDGATVDPNDPYIARALLDRDLVDADEAIPVHAATPPPAPASEEGNTAPSRPARSKEQVPPSSDEDKA